MVCKPFREGGGGRVDTSPKMGILGEVSTRTPPSLKNVKCKRSTKCWRLGDLKFSSEVYPDKRLRLRKFQDGQLSRHILQKILQFIP